MTEEEARLRHVAACKDRAFAYLNDGNLKSAVASMISDLSKRNDTNPHLALIGLGMMYVINEDEQGVRRWIEGFQ